RRLRDAMDDDTLVHRSEAEGASVAYLDQTAAATFGHGRRIDSAPRTCDLDGTGNESRFEPKPDRFVKTAGWAETLEQGTATIIALHPQVDDGHHAKALAEQEVLQRSCSAGWI